MFIPLFSKRRYEDICDSKRLSDRGILVAFADEIDSTSAEARRWAECGGKAPALFVAERQTAGRGRLGRSFYSPSDTGIYMTLLLEIGEDFPDTAGLTSAAAVAVLRGTDRLTQGKTQIKWVNDILLDGKKICGILAESFLVGDKTYAAIGIGVNVSTKDFPEDIRGIAGSSSGGMMSGHSPISSNMHEDMSRDAIAIDIILFMFFRFIGLCRQR